MNKNSVLNLYVENTAHKIDCAHFGMKCAKWSGMYPNYHIRSYKPF